MSDKVAVFITNYNMGERADALYEFIERKTRWPVDIYLTDNASDLVPPAVHTNVWIRGHNKQTTAGWLEGLKAAKSSDKYTAYVFMITSADFPETTEDPVTPMAEGLLDNPDIVGIHAALTPDSTTSWTHLITRGGTGLRRTWMIDNIMSMYRADWFDSIGGFDPNLRYAWGIDLETCWKARQQGRELHVCENVKIRKITDIAYAMDRMRMSAEERRRLAGQNMEFYLSQRYGDNWRDRMLNEYVRDEWR